MSRRRLEFSWWGASKRLTMPKWAVVIDDEAPIAAIKRAITNATGHGIVSSRSDGTALDARGQPESHHYELTLGHLCKEGGSSVVGRVWVAVPIERGEA